MAKTRLWQPGDENDPVIARPDLVRGTMGQASRKPTKYFYVVSDDGGSEIVWEWDGYMSKDPNSGEPQWVILITCPRCHNTLRIDTSKKPLRVSKDGLETDSPIRCSWEEKDKAKIRGGFGACGWACELRPVRGSEKHASVRMLNGRMQKVTVDAVVVKA